ncbi:MAG: hypothetical protein ACI4I2_00790 [Oscillospiraceae bacterium]
MTYCKNCHKMSKDDDFCSHCGSAVWGEDYVSQDAAINCDTMKDHSHDKVTYSKSERGEGVHIPEGYKPYNPTYSRSPKAAEKSKNGKGVLAVISTVVTLSILKYIIEAIIEMFD